jgi:GH24 family phage-related lysozyme (muramidase)
MSNDKPITLEQLFRYKQPWGKFPHQDASIIEMEEDIQANGYAVAMRRDRPWFKAWSQDGKQPDPIYLAPAQAIIKNWEGCKLAAYADSGGIWTIGWGTTSVNGTPVRKGDQISQALADELLRAEILRIAAELHQIIPAVAKWGGNQQAALISWAYNVGLGAVKDSTLRKRINAGESAQVVIPQELPKWNKVNGKPLEGLTRRRAAEVALFVGAAIPPAPPPTWRNVPWYAQLDSATDQARRMCFSSSCAMLLEAIRPGTLNGPNGDDQYLKRVLQYGDTTDSGAQIRALASYGVKASFTRMATWELLEKQLKAGVPVPCGYLHRGHVSAPAGGGHWLCVVGINPDAVIVHDPLGEADLVTGATIDRPARFCSYSRKNFGLRWMVEGPGTGWAVIAQP